MLYGNGYWELYDLYEFGVTNLGCWVYHSLIMSINTYVVT